MTGRRPSLIRADDDAAHRVSFFELFFDLVYVFAITQLSHGLLQHLDLQGLVQTLILLLAVWWAWVYTTWATNWLDPDSTRCRLMLIGVMAAALVMAASIPEAFGEAGLAFALAYAAIQVGRSSFVLWAMRDDPVRRASFRRIVAWNAAAALIWIAGGLVDESARMPIWIIALMVDYAAPAVRYVFPGLGRSETTEWTVTPSYISERFKLFIILALGESIIVTGAAFSEHDPDLATLAAFASAFAGAVAMWWIYFHRSADEGEQAMGSSDDPGRIARSATYFHLPIVAGIIVTAVADELVIANPTGTSDAAIVATSLGGAALFLAGHAILRYSVFGLVSMPRIIGIAVLAALAPIGLVLSPLALGLASTGVLIGVAIHETLIRPAAEEERVVLEDGQLS